ncbi:hypothetical protein GW17_00030020, partial [Ensete ventricosum]
FRTLAINSKHTEGAKQRHTWPLVRATERSATASEVAKDFSSLLRRIDPRPRPPRPLETPTRLSDPNWTDCVAPIAYVAGVVGRSCRNSGQKMKGNGADDAGPPAESSCAPPLEWKFSQVFGERIAGEEVQEGTSFCFPFVRSVFDGAGRA